VRVCVTELLVLLVLRCVLMAILAMVPSVAEVLLDLMLGACKPEWRAAQPVCAQPGLRTEAEGAVE